MTKSLYIGLVNISCLASSESISLLNISGISLINSVKGFFELLTRGIFVIAITDWTSIKFSISITKLLT